MKRLTALICLPVAFLAIVVLRGEHPRTFWRLYWEASR